MRFSHHWVDVVVVVVGVVTLMLVALLENEQWRNAKATQRKLNALAEAVAHILAADETAGEQVEQLRVAYGLEKRESISDCLRRFRITAVATEHQPIVPAAHLPVVTERANGAVFRAPPQLT